MTPKEIKLIRASFLQVLLLADTAVELFYARLFELDPSLQHLIKGDVREQGHQLMKVIRRAIPHLNRLDQVTATDQVSCVQQACCGSEGKDYEVVEAALLWTLEMGLGEDFTPETRAAWVEVCALLANVMKKVVVQQETAPPLRLMINTQDVR